jgi:hypothetical protein
VIAALRAPALLALLALLALAPAVAAAQQGGSVLIVPPEQDGTILPEIPPDEDTLIEELPPGGDGTLLAPDLDLSFLPDDSVVEEAPPVAVTAPGAVLRGLDKLTGETTDLELANGEGAVFGKLQVTLGECRFPEGNPAGDAYAHLVIRRPEKPEALFDGWMIASSPALNALDDPRYDVWVLRCKSA